VADVIIAGGGPVGSVLALALRGCGVSVVQVRAGTAASERPIALSYGSRLLLEREGAWPVVSPTAIAQIHVSQQGAFGRTLIRAADYSMPALGYVAAYSSILGWLSAAGAAQLQIVGIVTDWSARTDDIEVRITPSGGGEIREHARLLVLADGGHIETTEGGRDYGQQAIVAEVQSERPHRNIAWERFTPGGPLALLPYQNRHALVWCVETGSAQALLALPEDEFLRRLGASFGRRLGNFVGVSARASFPLALRHRHGAPSRRTILIGNAAQTLHPVAGQGMNLGLRDACELAELIASTPPPELGSEGFLKRYAAQRRLDRSAGIRFTDSLVRVFSTAAPALAAVRGAGLALLDIAPPARGFLARRMIYGARSLP
jgi:2-octaprenyl-6-methoxyphenol hydroxylase